MKKSSFPVPNKVYIYIISLLFLSNHTYAQTLQQEKMEQLHFIIGNWVGISTTYENGEISKQTPAHEQISYKLDKSIITIDLHSATLQLHTVIYYDETVGKYFYNPYYKTGAARYEAQYTDGKLIVMPNDQKRFIFTITAEGEFREYGEKLVDGRWIKYFEDIFKSIP